MWNIKSIDQYMRAVFIIFMLRSGSCLYLNRGERGLNDNLCLNKACVRYAGKLIDNIDTTVDPCESFYDFACGSFTKNTDLASDQGITGGYYGLVSKIRRDFTRNALKEPVLPADSRTVRNVKYFFQSCMNYEDIAMNSEANLLVTIEKLFGGWPLLLDDDYAPSDSSFLMSFLNSIKLNIQSILSIKVQQNPKNPNIRSISIKRSEQNYAQQISIPQFLQRYKEFMSTIAIYLNSNSLDLKDQIDDMIELLSKLASISIDDPESTPNMPIKLKDLNKLIPNFPWKSIINTLLGDINTSIDDDEIILITNPNCIRNAVGIFNSYRKSNKRAFINLMVWSYVYRYGIDTLTEKFIRAKIEFESSFSGVNGQIERDKFCSEIVYTQMLNEAGILYVKKYFANETFSKVYEIGDYIQEEFVNILSENLWMDDHTKKIALKKLSFLDKKLGISKNLLNDTLIDSIYDYDMNNENFLRNRILAGFNEFKRSIKIYTNPISKDDWVISPFIVNAMYNPDQNEFYMTASFLHEPFYNKELPNYVNFAGAGFFMGHEMTHGFDNNGRHYDEKGIYYEDGQTSFWSNETLTRFEEETDCMVSQYNGYIIPELGLQVNGYLTLGENIADNGGLKESYRAYKKWESIHGKEKLLPSLEYNQDQLFFIAFAQQFCEKIRPEIYAMRSRADEHAPSKFRVLGTTSNLPEFSKAFKCIAGQSNDPFKKCRIW